MPRLPTVTPRQLIEALEKVGFEIDHQTGNHVVLWRASDAFVWSFRGTIVTWAED